MKSFAPMDFAWRARRLGLPLRVFALLLFLDLLTVFFDLLGILLVLPILEVIQAGGGAAIDKLEGRHWTIMRDVSASIGMPISLGLLLVLSFSFIVIRQVFRYYSVRYGETVQRRMANSIRSRAFNRFLRADTGIQDGASVGSVVTLLKTDLRRALDVLLAITKSVSLVAQVVFYFAALFLLSPIMCLLCLALAAAVLLATRGQFAEIGRRGGAMSNANKALGNFMVERLKHARLIRLSGTEKAEVRAFNQISADLADQELQQKMIAVRVQSLLEPGAIGVAYLMFFVGGQVLGLGLDRLGFLAILLIKLVPVLRATLAQWARIAGQMPSLIKLDSFLMEIGEASESKGGPLRFERLTQGIQYRDVSFSYNPRSDRRALHDISLFISAHRMTALVGPSGAGKSTLIDLLPRFRRPASGEISFDGINIAEFSTVSLREGIAFVPQHPQIFDITAAEHIRYGKEDASDEEVREAARLAGALAFIEQLPQGFETQLGDGGKRLSGGQRQRLDIARALVRRAPILILDEPTSAVDAEAEAAFRDALMELRATTDLTIIVIAHRLSTVADADQIVVLQQGRLIESGTHQQLLAACDWYADAYEAQHGHRRSLSRVSA